MGAHLVPLPTLSDDLIAIAATNQLATAEPKYVLPYHHFRLVMNRERRLAFFTAVNIDGASSFRLKRESDRWSFDPRISPQEQTGEDAYRDNPLDRGHLVRRLDPAWGPTPEYAKVCNDDTFHFTNCSPQHEEFNQSQTTWAGLEDYILENADNLNFRVSVFTGPVFDAGDQPFQGVQLPRQFWKVVAMVKEERRVVGHSVPPESGRTHQGIGGAPEEFSYVAYETYQVPIRQIEALTGLSFGTLADADPFGKLEAAVAAREISRPDQLVL